jgi:hypothetical protein
MSCARASEGLEFPWSASRYDLICGASASSTPIWASSASCDEPRIHSRKKSSALRFSNNVSHGASNKNFMNLPFRSSPSGRGCEKQTNCAQTPV